MKYEYERADLKITEFDIEDEITTSGQESQTDPVSKYERENAYNPYSYIDDVPGGWN